MKTWRYTISLFCLIILGLLSPRLALADSYTLSGHIVDGSGNNVEGATVSVNDQNNDSTLTDESGNYTMSIPEGTYDVQVTPPSEGDLTSSISPNRNISANTEIDFVLTDSSVVSFTGQVFDTYGNIVGNQTVDLRTDQGGHNIVNTDATGRYSFTVAAGTYTLCISSWYNDTSLPMPQGFYVQASGLTLSQSTVANVYIPFKKVTVHVQDINNNPVSNVALTNIINSGQGFGDTISLGSLFSTVYSQSYYPNSSTAPTTDSSGNADMWLLPNASYSPFYILATPPSGSSFRQTLLDNAVISEDTTLYITMIQPVTVEGYVYDRDGGVLADQVVNYRTDEGVQNTATTDQDGHYSVEIVPHTYNIAISATANSGAVKTAEGYGVTSTAVTVTESTQIDFHLPFKKVTVHTQDKDGNPVAGVTINNSISSGQGQTDLISMGGDIVGYGQSYYVSSSYLPVTDEFGNVDMWLFTNNPASPYLFHFAPGEGSTLPEKTVTDVNITDDQTVNVTMWPTHDAPVTTMSVTSEVDTIGSYDTPATVELNAIPAEGFSVAGTYFTVDGSAQITFTGPFSVAGDGDHTINYWSVDNTGKEESVGTSIINVHTDTTPVINGLLDTTLEPGGIYDITGVVEYNEDVTATVDYGEGAGDEALTLNGDKTFTLNHQYNAEGQYVVSVKITDDEDNITTANATIIVALPTPTEIPTATPIPAPTYTISGVVFNDINANGIQDEGENGVEGVSLTNWYTTVTTDGEGNYSLPNLEENYYEVIMTAPEGNLTTTTNPALLYVTVDTTLNFGVVAAPHYDITGKLFTDANLNGFQDEGETGYEGVTVSLGGQTATTDSNGDYTFPSVVMGDYTESLVLPEGYLSTTANPIYLTLSDNTVQNFGMIESQNYNLTGNVFTDVNQNGIQDEGETGYEGATVNMDGQSTTTDSNGDYAFNDVTIGNYNTSVTLPDGYIATTTDAVYVTLNGNTQQNFGVAVSPRYNFTGMVFADENENGVQDGGEVGFEGATVSLNGQYIVTDSTGDFAFNNVIMRNYTVRISISSDYYVTTSNPLFVNLNADKTGKFGVALAPHYNLTGKVFTDANQNGVQDEGETGYEGAEVTIEGQSRTTDSNGDYSFNNIVGNSYTEIVTLPDGYVATTTNPVYLYIEANTEQNFGIVTAPTAEPTPTDVPAPTYTLSGIVFNDANQNGVQDEGETGYEGATVALDETHTATTDSTGHYELLNIAEGAYNATLTVPEGYTASTSNPVAVSLSANTEQNYGIAAN